MPETSNPKPTDEKLHPRTPKEGALWVTVLVAWVLSVIGVVWMNSYRGAQLVEVQKDAKHLIENQDLMLDDQKANSKWREEVKVLLEEIAQDIKRK